MTSWQTAPHQAISSEYGPQLACICLTLITPITLMIIALISWIRVIRVIREDQRTAAENSRWHTTHAALRGQLLAECCTFDYGHDGPCEWLCFGCLATGRCLQCGGTSTRNNGKPCLVCGGTGRCQWGCTDGKHVESNHTPTPRPPVEQEGNA